MTPEQKELILRTHHAFPDGCRYRQASESELASFEAAYGTIPADYRWYLANCGGGVIGSEWIDGIRELPQSHKRFVQERDRGFYTMSKFFLIGWDGGGNPYGFDLSTGKIVTEDHDFGGVHVVAEDFFDLLFKKGMFN